MTPRLDCDLDIGRSLGSLAFIIPMQHFANVQVLLNPVYLKRVFGQRYKLKAILCTDGLTFLTVVSERNY